MIVITGVGTALYGVDDEDEHIKYTMEKGNVPVRVESLEELYDIVMHS